MNYKALICLFTLSLFSNLNAEIHSQNSPEHLERLERIYTEEHIILEKCECILEHISQIIANDTKDRYDRSGLEQIKEVKASIRSIRSFNTDLLSESILTAIHVQTSIIIAYLNHIYNKKLKEFPQLQFSFEQILYRTQKEPLAISDLEEQIIYNRAFIDVLFQQADQVGLSFLNKFYRSVEYLDHKLKISSMVKRMLPYSALMVWLILTTDKKTLENIPVFGTIKEFLGNTPQKKKITKTIPIEHDEVNKNNFETMKRIAEQAKQLSEQENLSPAQLQDALKYFAQALAPNAESGVGSETTEAFENGGGFLGKILYSLHSVIQLDEKALIQFAPTTLILPYLQRDLIDLQNWLRKKWIVTQNNLRGSHLTVRSSHDARKPRITFDNLIGLEDAKAILRDIVLYISDPERFNRSGTAIGRGFLLEGPTRTGKTFIAEALAGEISKALTANGKSDKCGFKEVKWYDLMQKDGIKAVIEEAKQDAPCVLFIDEIDLLRLKKDGDSISLSEFLTGMSGLDRDEKNMVILIAATNSPRDLAEQLLQSGRFGTIIHFENPHFAERKKFFEINLEKITIDPSEFDIVQLAQATEGASFGDLDAIVKHAQFKAKTAGERLTQKHFDEAINYRAKHIMSSENLSLSPKELELLACHQAGHALAYLLLEPSIQLQSVTILPISKIREKQFFYNAEKNKSKSVKYGQIFTYHTNEVVQPQSHIDKLKMIKIELAGHMAEEILLGSKDYHYHHKDKQKALTMAKEIVFAGIDNTKDNISHDVREQLLKEAYNLVLQLEQEIKELLLHYTDDLRIIAQNLQQKKTMTTQQIKRLLVKDLVENRILPQEALA